MLAKKGLLSAKTENEPLCWMTSSEEAVFQCLCLNLAAVAKVSPGSEWDRMI